VNIPAPPYIVNPYVALEDDAYQIFRLHVLVLDYLKCKKKKDYVLGEDGTPLNNCNEKKFPQSVGLRKNIAKASSRTCKQHYISEIAQIFN